MWLQSDLHTFFPLNNVSFGLCNSGVIFSWKIRYISLHASCCVDQRFNRRWGSGLFGGQANLCDWHSCLWLDFITALPPVRIQVLPHSLLHRKQAFYAKTRHDNCGFYTAQRVKSQSRDCPHVWFIQIHSLARMRLLSWAPCQKCMLHASEWQEQWALSAPSQGWRWGWIMGSRCTVDTLDGLTQTRATSKDTSASRHDCVNFTFALLQLCRPHLVTEFGKEKLRGRKRAVV